MGGFTESQKYTEASLERDGGRNPPLTLSWLGAVDQMLAREVRKLAFGTTCPVFLLVLVWFVFGSDLLVRSSFFRGMSGERRYVERRFGNERDRKT